MQFFFIWVLCVAEKRHRAPSAWRLAAAERKHFSSRAAVGLQTHRTGPWQGGGHVFRLLLYQPRREDCLLRLGQPRPPAMLPGHAATGRADSPRSRSHAPVAPFRRIHKPYSTLRRVRDLADRRLTAARWAPARPGRNALPALHSGPLACRLQFSCQSVFYTKLCQ